MSEEIRSRAPRLVLRSFVTLALLGVCFGTEVFILPTFTALISSWGGGDIAEWATVPLGLMPWVLALVTFAGVVMITLAKKEARSATAATALAAVDSALVLWAFSISLFLLDVVITIPRVV